MQTRDNPDVFSSGSYGSMVANRVLEELKLHGVVGKEAKHREGETLREMLSRLDVDPHDNTAGSKNPIVMSLVHELEHSLSANMIPISTAGNPEPAPRIVSSAAIGSPIGYASTHDRDPQASNKPSNFNDQDYEEVDDGLVEMMQGERVMVQTFSFDTKFPVTRTDASGKPLPDHYLARFQGMPVTVADILSRRREVYGEKVWDENIRPMNELAQSGGLCGQIDHPSHPGRGMGGNGIQYEKVYWSPQGRRSDGGRELWADGKIMATTDGHNLWTQLQAKVPTGISSRGRGDTRKGTWVDQLGNIHQDVGLVTVFRCQAFDAVSGEASPGSGFYNAQIVQDTSDIEEEIVDRIVTRPHVRVLRPHVRIVG
jgi:hypothetical protein